MGDFSCHILLAVSAMFTLCIETCGHGDTTHCSETFIELRSKEIAGVNDTDIAFIIYRCHTTLSSIHARNYRLQDFIEHVLIEIVRTRNYLLIDYLMAVFQTHALTKMKR